jgi:hypothetical protein
LTYLAQMLDVMVAALAGRQKPDGTWDDGEGIRPAAYQSEIAQRVRRAGPFFLATPATDTVIVLGHALSHPLPRTVAAT